MTWFVHPAIAPTPRRRSEVGAAADKPKSVRGEEGRRRAQGRGGGGGRGEAGSGKRGDAKKPSFWKDKKRYQKIGFTSKVSNDCKTINIIELETKLDNYVTKNKAALKAETYTINLSDIKVDKLLGAGKITKKIEITVTSASKLAIKKVEAAGGKVILPTVKVKEVKKEVEKSQAQPKK